MSPPLVRGSFEPGGLYFSLPRGSLALSPARELLVARAARCAHEPDRSLARDTVRATSQLLNPEPVSELPAGEEVVDVHEEEVVWGGFLEVPYGHFLTESVSRLWPLLPAAELAGLPAVFTAPNDQLFVRDWFDAFGASLVPLPERGAVRFSKMYVPEPAWRYNAWIAPEVRDIHLQARRGIEVGSPPANDVIWLSRSKLQGRRPYDEALFEWLLGEHLTVVHPETMTLAAQVAALEGCRAVAGVAGSAFHTLLMTERTPECLYLCAPWDKPSFGAQHQLLDADATFAEALSPALWTQRAPRGRIAFPAGYHLSVPKALRALSETVLPGLLDDGRLQAFAEPERSASPGRHPRPRAGIETAVAELIHSPLDAGVRMKLGDAFESEGLTDCALEQFTAAADMS